MFIPVVEAFITSPVLLQAALSQLPMGDLNTLLRYICQYMPMGPCPGVAPPTGPPLTDGTSSDGVRCHLLIIRLDICSPDLRVL